MTLRRTPPHSATSAAASAWSVRGIRLELPWATNRQLRSCLAHRELLVPIYMWKHKTRSASIPRPLAHRYVPKCTTQALLSRSGRTLKYLTRFLCVSAKDRPNFAANAALDGGDIETTTLLCSWVCQHNHAMWDNSRKDITNLQLQGAQKLLLFDSSCLRKYSI